MKTSWISFLLVAVVFGAGGFYAGMTYGKQDTRGQQRQRLRPQGASEQRGPSGSTAPGSRAGRSAGPNQGETVSGEITAKGSNSLTLKLRDGSSKTVELSEDTSIGKFTTIAGSELSVGVSVMVRGSANPDGSIRAQSVQIRPAGSATLPEGSSRE